MSIGTVTISLKEYEDLKITKKDYVTLIRDVHTTTETKYREIYDNLHVRLGQKTEEVYGLRNGLEEERGNNLKLEKELKETKELLAVYKKHFDKNESTLYDLRESAYKLNHAWRATYYELNNILSKTRTMKTLLKDVTDKYFHKQGGFTFEWKGK